MTDVTSEDIAYRSIDGKELLGRIYRPATSGPVPYVVDVHGGAWRNGDRLNNQNPPNVVPAEEGFLSQWGEAVPERFVKHASS